MSDISKFHLSTALEVIYLDIMKDDNILVFILGIDELNHLYNKSDSICHDLVRAIGRTLCSTPKKLFLIPILAGTIEGPLNQYIRSSMHIPLCLPLPLLSNDMMLSIGRGIGTILPIIYPRIGKKNDVTKVCIKDVIEETKAALIVYYRFSYYTDSTGQALACVILGSKETSLQNILKGVRFSQDFPNIQVSIPDSIEVCQLLNRYPRDKNEDNLKIDLHKMAKTVFFNAVGAAFDDIITENKKNEPISGYM
ncbi:10013_t:CDS:2 [Entrophospora sp. SA101]|nr:10013_t:CDS:2 [Entrophospora sp. SA101]